jgi:AcrR family transcriptional regulator
VSNSERSRRRVGVHFEGDLRRALVDAAVATLDEGGAEALSLREVARRAGVSHAAPAHHFGDKTGLLTVVATEGFSRFAAELQSALASAGDDPVEALPALARAYAAFAERHPGQFAVMFLPGLARRDDPAYATAAAAAYDVLRRLVERGQRTGWHADADPAALTTACWALAHGLTALRTSGTSLDDIAAVSATLVVP